MDLYKATKVAQNKVRFSNRKFKTTSTSATFKELYEVVQRSVGMECECGVTILFTGYERYCSRRFSFVNKFRPEFITKNNIKILCSKCANGRRECYCINHSLPIKKDIIIIGPDTRIPNPMFAS